MSLFLGAPLFSVPAIISLVLRIVFGIYIGKNIPEKKREKQELEYGDTIFAEITNFLKTNKPPEQEHKEKGEKEEKKISMGKNTEEKKNDIK